MAVDMEELRGMMKNIMVDNIELKSSIHQLTIDATEIKHSLLGDEKYKRKGIVHEFEELKETVNGHTKAITDITQKHKMDKIYVGAGAAAISGTLAASTNTSIWSKIGSVITTLFTFGAK